MSDFANVPVDDTDILFSLEVKLGERDILYQQWYCDGVKAESFIFAADDVVGMSDQDLEKEARTSPAINIASSVTIGRGGNGFTFVNFNFLTSGGDGFYEKSELLTPEQELKQKQKNIVAIGARNQNVIDRIKKQKTKAAR